MENQDQKKIQKDNRIGTLTIAIILALSHLATYGIGFLAAWFRFAK